MFLNKFLLIVTLVMAGEYIVLDELEDGYKVVNGQICDVNDNCVPEIFQPSRDFKKIVNGQKVPKGLHITMDYTTGEKMAKFLENSPDSKAVNAVQVATGSDTMSSESSKPAAAVIHHEKEPDPSANLRQLLTLEEKETLTGLFANLNTTKPADTISATLQLLSDSAHHFDVGVGIAGNKGQVNHLILLLSHENEKVRASVAILLGTILSNNDIAQNLVLENQPGFIRDLVAVLINEPDGICKKRLIFALSAILRGNKQAVDIFVALEPFKLLIILSKDAKLSSKVFALINDIKVAFPPQFLEEICKISGAAKNHEANKFQETCMPLKDEL